MRQLNTDCDYNLNVIIMNIQNIKIQGDFGNCCRFAITFNSIILGKMRANVNWLYFND